MSREPGWVIALGPGSAADGALAERKDGQLVLDAAQGAEREVPGVGARAPHDARQRGVVARADVHGRATVTARAILRGVGRDVVARIGVRANARVDGGAGPLDGAAGGAGGAA